MMKQRPNEKLSSFWFSGVQLLFFTVACGFLFCFRGWLPAALPITNLLTVKLPLLLLISSLITDRLLKKQNRSLIRKFRFWDTVCWIVIPVTSAVFLLFGSWEHAEILTRVIYLLAFSSKAGIIGSAIYIRQKQSYVKPVFIFLAALWFYSFYSFAYLPVHAVSGDEPHYLLMARSLFSDLDLNLYNQYEGMEYASFYGGILEPKPSDIVRPGEIYSRGLGASFPAVLALPSAIAGYNGAVFFTILCTALLVLQLYLLLISEIEDRTAVTLAVMLTATSLPILSYSGLIYPDILAALLILTALRLLQIPPLTRSGRSVPTLLVVISTCLIFLKFRYFTPVLLLVTPLFFGRYRNRRRNSVLFLTLLIFGGLYVFIDRNFLSGDLFLRRFGNWYGIQRYIPDLSSLRVFPGLLIDQESGLLIYAPIYLIALIGWVFYSEKRGFTYWFAWLAPLLTATSLLGHFAWHCLPTPPLRYLLPVLPAMALFTASAIRRWSSSSPLFHYFFIGIVAWNWFIAALITLDPSLMVNMADGSAEILVRFGRLIDQPVHLFFPSLIRPGTASFVWITSLFVLCIFFLWKRNAVSLKPRYQTLYIPVTIFFLFLLGGFLLWSGGHIYTYHCEDRDWIITSSGRYEPEIRDPFFHQETRYGWQLDPENTVEIPIRIKPGEYSVVISAKTVQTVEPQRFSVQADKKALARFTVSKKTWSDFGFRFSAAEQIESILIEAKQMNIEPLAINSIHFVPVSQNRFRLWQMLAGLCRKLTWQNATAFCMKQAFLSKPGDPWNVIRRYIPSAVSHAGSDATGSAADDAFFEQFFTDICQLDWRSIHSMATLTSSNLMTFISEENKCDYLQTGLVYGNPRVARKRFRKEYCHSSDTPLLLQNAIAAYATNEMVACVEALDMYLLETDRYPLRLSRPSQFVSSDHPFRKILQDIEDNPRYQVQVPMICNKHLIDSVTAYHQKDFQLSSRLLDNYYQSDFKEFMEKVPYITPDFLEKTLRYTCRIHPQHTQKIIDIGFENGRYRAVLAAADYGLRMFPSNPDFHYSRALTLFYLGDIDQAREACLLSMALCHDSDKSRWLMEQIYKNSFIRSSMLGAVISDEDDA